MTDSAVTLKMVQDAMDKIEGFDSPIRDLASFTQLFGFDIHVSPYLERNPNVNLESVHTKPDWLTEKAWAEHRNWCGEFFGWTDDPVYMIGRNKLIMSMNNFQMIKHDGFNSLINVTTS